MMDIRLYQINRERDEERRALLSTEALADEAPAPRLSTAVFTTACLKVR